MISRLRSWIAVTLAVLVTLLTFGLQDDPARPRVAEPRSRAR